MKTIFVVNPKAGQGKEIPRMISAIETTARNLNADVEIYLTKAVGDGTRFVKEYCEQAGAARFIACGGDGTLNEVLNGVMAFPDCEMGVIPMGTGNDFCRNFGNNHVFWDIAAQIQGKCIPCDAIRYRTWLCGEERAGYGINMFNIGFDCSVADMTAKMKEKPLISGSLAYLVSVFGNLIRKKVTHLKIEIDDEIAYEGALLLTSIANGSYCGGGMKSNPLASVRDGNLNINMIKNVSLLQFLKLLPRYMNGSFLSLPNIEKIISSVTCKKVTITPQSGTMCLCTDGEISDAGRTEFAVISDAFRFVVPQIKSEPRESAALGGTS
ncbi:MAG: YegS/Rv2252/BmrU family lipid kinase [Clostridia bacterium]|nr:YegS/Rv2252/BmrU family lipid kinase [Clostridia bacterium]